MDKDLKKFLDPKKTDYQTTFHDKAEQFGFWVTFLIAVAVMAMGAIYFIRMTIDALGL
jgi:hypothetical protein